jgi:hypothetical protein
MFGFVSTIYFAIALDFRCGILKSANCLIMASSMDVRGMPNLNVRNHLIPKDRELIFLSTSLLDYAMRWHDYISDIFDDYRNLFDLVEQFNYLDLSLEIA